ncbi:hypothetical protein AC622_04475 [Bacillus sp. FJAT-27916]|uniref:hypothetical protein n=1 Tax=Bacillaceae TaxID=186817 RepID=UPI000670B31C|nr:hypothetical protein [Bacillus sp. FJAT-27916]KMY43580.1 hypothetical protein AC622_04475 [Bacillus sp. FJAT-27916]
MEIIMTIFIGVFIMFIGLLVLKKKALFLVNVVLWNGVTGNEKWLSRIFGTILLVVGFFVILLPFFM